MKSTVLKFGLISGAVLMVIIATAVSALRNDKVDFEHSQIVGYAAMVAAFLSVFFGIRSYREKNGGGAITFGKALKVGILIVLVACAMYVVAWEIVYFGFVPDFADKYAAYSLEQMRAKGASPEKLAEETRRMESFKVWYRNPLFNAGMTFLEVFPAGLIMALVSAAILRRKPQQWSAAPQT